MGLDMYLFKRKKNAKEEDDLIELGYWRKYWPLHEYIKSEWELRNPDEKNTDFNGIPVYLSDENIKDIISYCEDALEEIIAKENIIEADEKYVGIYGTYNLKGEVEYSIKTFKTVLKETNFETEEVFYDSSW